MKVVVVQEEYAQALFDAVASGEHDVRFVGSDLDGDRYELTIPAHVIVNFPVGRSLYFCAICDPDIRVPDRRSCERCNGIPLGE